MNLFLTPIGQSKLTQSLANPNEPLVFSKMVIGDWKGGYTTTIDSARPVREIFSHSRYGAVTHCFCFSIAVQNIVDTRNGEKRPVEPKPLRDLGWKQKNLDVIHRAMIGVNKEGTGARAFAGAEYVSAGKTGTAQVFSYKGAEHKTETMAAHLRDHALFIAFAPADKPTIALAVLVENGGFGAQAAAPIARQVLDYYLLGRKPKAPALPDEAAAEGDG